MYCLRCGTENEENRKYCKNCNCELTNSHDNQSRYSYNYSNTTEEKPDNHQNQYQYSYEYAYNNNLASEDKYEKAYIGKNFKNIKYNNFSIPSLLLGPIYYLYRKIYNYTLLWILALIVVNYYMPKYMFPLTVVLNIASAIKFKMVYQRKMENDIEKIKCENIDYTTQELIKACAKKGGTLGTFTFSKNLVVGLIILITLASIILPIISEYYYYYKTDNENTNIPSTNKQIQDLNYLIPKGFKSGYEGTFSSYYIQNNTAKENICELSISIIPNSYNKYTEEEYLRNKYPNTINTIEVKYINNNQWKKLTTINQTEYNATVENVYAKSYKDYIYLIKYNISNNNDKTCAVNEEKIINSLSFY